MYSADKGNIFRSLKNSLHEQLFLVPFITLIAIFFNLNIHLLLVELPPKIKSYDNTEWKKKQSVFHYTI